MSRGANRIGEKRMMNCGMMATVVAQRSATDLDVEFEGGALAEHKKWSHFKDGRVAHPGSKSHVGETHVNNNGAGFIIVEQSSYRDCTVQFEDGVVKKHVSYESIKTGSVSHPNKYALMHIGEEYMTNLGLKAIVIAWRSEKDIDVRFENGKIGAHKSFSNLKTGQIAWDGYKKSAAEYIGMTRVHNVSGLMMAIKNAESLTNMDVEFSDGYLAAGVALQRFLKGTVSHPGYPATRVDRIGEKALSKCRMYMTITCYRKSRDIDVEFEDGSVKKHASYDDFLTGLIYPEGWDHSRKNERIGLHKITNQGFGITVTGYTNSNLADFTFDDGTKVCGRQFRSFANGSITYPEKNRWAGFSIKHAWSEGDDHYYNCRCSRCGLEDILTPEQMVAHMQSHD